MSYALEGMKIVDFGIFFAGPYAAKLLGDLGASVIKVEALTGDPLRRTVGAFNGCQRNKRSIAIDMKSDEGRAIAHRLMSEADIVCHNMRPGVAQRLGIDYETAKGLKHDILYLYSPAFGTVGPRADQPGFEPLVSAIVGIEVNCAGKGNDPVRTIGNMDYGNGLLGASGLLMALIHRVRTGEGQYIECPQLVSGMVTTSEVYFRPDGSLSPQYELDQQQTGYGPLCRLYETTEGWVCIVAASERQFRALCAALGVPQVAEDPRFATPEAREATAEALAAALASRFKARPAAEWASVLDAAGVPCEVSTSGGAARFLNDPEHLASGLVAEYQHPQYGAMREVGLTIRLSETPGRVWGPPPLIGQHTRDILAELGFDPA
ncbi:MAG: CoA transferase, partial [Dehalococcoidia bacterium]